MGTEHGWWSTPSIPQAWQASKVRQDKQLDSIERGLETLRGLGEAMSENLQGQEVLTNDVQDKVWLPTMRMCDGWWRGYRMW